MNLDEEEEVDAEASAVPPVDSLAPVVLEPRSFVVVDSYGSVEEEFVTGILPTSSAVSSAVIAVCVIDGRLLVALPAQAWHRAVSKRKIDPKCLQKPLLVSVEACFATDRGSPIEEEMPLKVWVGFLQAEWEAQLIFDSDQEPEITFGEDPHEEPLLPQAQALAQIVSEHFAFRSAESHAAEPPSTESRLNQLEKALGGIQESLVKILEKESTGSKLRSTAAGSSGPRVISAKPSARPQAESVPDVSQLPGFDRSTVQAALQAGIPEAHLREMSVLLQGKEGKIGDGVKPPVRKKSALSESEDELIEDTQTAGADPDDGDGSGKVGEAIAKLTKICSHLAKDSKKKKETVESLLDGSGLVASSESGGLPSSRRNAATLRALQRALVENPKYLYESIEANMLSDFSSRPTSAGEPLQAGTVRGWLCQRSRIQNYTNQVRWTWQVGGIWDALIAGKTEEARARCAILVGASDQSSIDGGNWVLSNVALLEGSPPYQLFSNHLPPGPHDPQRTALFDPRWLEVYLGHVREMDQYQEAKRKIGKGNNRQGEIKEDPAPKVKAKAKAKGGHDASSSAN